MSVSKKYISAQQLLDDSFNLGLQILDSGFIPNYIVGVWRGGTLLLPMTSSAAQDTNSDSSKETSAKLDENDNENEAEDEIGDHEHERTQHWQNRWRFSAVAGPPG